MTALAIVAAVAAFWIGASLITAGVWSLVVGAVKRGAK